MDVKINKTWQPLLKEEFEKEYFSELMSVLESEYNKQTIYPPKKDIFKAFDYCTFDNLKIVILGQDPYHGPNQANGLAFSVKKGIKIPPSLRNIYKELQLEFNFDYPSHGDLSEWAEQGVLLLNTTLTVREGEANSHSKYGWSIFTDRIISLISDKKENIVFILWGANAQSKKEMIDESKHLILESVHPSPLSASRGFFGNEHFKKANIYLKENDIDPIDWEIQGDPKLF